MLVAESFTDINTPTGLMRVHFLTPRIPQYPKAKFPGVIVYSEIYQTTAPVLRFAQSIAAEGYVVAAPCVFHEFEGPDPIAYDTEGTDRGNRYKYEKTLQAYNDDNKLALDALAAHPNCNGRLAATGMCLGGHLAFRAAFDPRIEATVCYFPTDIHDEKLSASGSDTLKRAAEISEETEVVLYFGVDDTHVNLAGRNKIRDTLTKLPKPFRLSFLELQAAHAFIRDTSSKGRYDGALSRVCFTLLMEVFGRTIGTDRGPRDDKREGPEHVC